MPAKDTYHHQVKNALIKAGWRITHDPYVINYGDRGVYVDLGAERLLAAERDNERIAVEIKCFLSDSDISDFEDALGQYVFYRSLLKRTDPDRKLFLAIPDLVYNSTFLEPIVVPVQEDVGISIITVNILNEEIVAWKP